MTEAEQNPGVHQRKDLTLDGAGGARTDISDIPRESTPVEVHAELEYRDPNGESQTVSNNVMIWPAKRWSGFRSRIGRRRPALFARILRSSTTRENQSLTRRCASIFSAASNIRIASG